MWGFSPHTFNIPTDMKLLFLLVLQLLCLAKPLVSQAQISSVIDERHELSGIVWRLAGAKEYAENRVIESYAADIESYFGKYRHHPLMDYIRQLRKKPYLVAYDGIPGVAELFVIRNNRITLNPDADLSKYVSQVDYRWTEEAIRRYCFLLNDFYRKTRFRDFFEMHRELYVHATQSMDKRLESIQFQWFESFFGKPIGKPKVIVCLSYGYNNYALTPKLMDCVNETDAGIVLGCTRTDENGIPVFGSGNASIIIHEFTHNFSNPLVERYYDRLSDPASIIFPFVKDLLVKNAYADAKTMMLEGMTNLFQIMYQKELDNPTYYHSKIAENSGFVWMGRAIKFMDNFYADRDLYTNIEQFMPELIGFMEHIASHMDTVMHEFDNRNPYVVNTYPCSMDANPDIKELRITFSQPMFGATSFATLRKEGVVALEEEDRFWADEKTYVIKIKGPLKRNTVYGTLLIGRYFIAKTGHTMRNNYELIFKTVE